MPGLLDVPYMSSSIVCMYHDIVYNGYIWASLEFQGFQLLDSLFQCRRIMMNGSFGHTSLARGGGGCLSCLSLGPSSSSRGEIGRGDIEENPWRYTGSDGSSCFGRHGLNTDLESSCQSVTGRVTTLCSCTHHLTSRNLREAHNGNQSLDYH